MRYYALVLLVLTGSTALAQSDSVTISGGVYLLRPDGARIPQSYASVMLPGVATTTTDDKGQYVLDLSRHPQGKPGMKYTLNANSLTGYGEKECTVPTDASGRACDVEIRETPTAVLWGNLLDKQTRSVIEGVQATVVIQNYPDDAPVAVSDENGVFRLHVLKKGLDPFSQITLMLKDGKARYKNVTYKTSSVKAAPLEILLEKMD